MAGDDDIAQMQRTAVLRVLDGVRPQAPLDWVSPLAPAVTQALVGAGHWSAGRRRRAAAAWTGAAGFALVAWGLATEAPTRAEADKATEQYRDQLRKLGVEAPPAHASETFMADPRVRIVVEGVLPAINTIFDIRRGLRRPRRLSPFAIADEALFVAIYSLRVPRALRQARPRTALGSALVVTAALARLRAAHAEPLP